MRSVYLFFMRACLPRKRGGGGGGGVKITMYRVQLITTKSLNFTAFKRFFPGISILLSRSKVSL